MEPPEAPVSEGWIAIVGGAVLLAAAWVWRIMIRASDRKECRNYQEEKIDRLDEKVDNLENRLTAVETVLQIRRRR